MSSEIDEQILVSRFINTDDTAWRKCVFDLPRAWWSRVYEYAWAANFAFSDAVVLDAACGLSHPFKFFLQDNCKKVHACDFDGAILSQKEIIKAVEKDFGTQIAANLPRRYLTEIDYVKASVTQLPYPESSFDRIFCISVLEHLEDAFNKQSSLSKFPFLRPILKKEIYKSLAEFNRVLKPGGYIVLTFDYPDINLDYLRETIQRLNLAFVGQTGFDLPPNALHFDEKDLYCFRALLRKRVSNTDRYHNMITIHGTK